MPTKKNAASSRRKTARRSSPAPKRSKTASSGVSAMASTQFKQLRKTVDQLKARLEKETKARSAASTLVTGAKKARETILGQMKSLKEQGARLSKELKKALTDTNRHKAAREQALAKVAELRAELARRTSELKSKSEELGKLAMDSAGRAKDIINSERAPSQPSSGKSVHREKDSESDASRVTETETITEETMREEESPRESSIEREVHPERKNEPNY